ncbi:hypothetical protein BJ170DRAFT_697530 [Xylariales sp. AK1849]|nr:hypothetical protein BJ170DRAFT_697530 [Xylariales sp. AK1849]
MLTVQVHINLADTSSFRPRSILSHHSSIQSHNSSLPAQSSVTTSASTFSRLNKSTTPIITMKPSTIFTLALASSGALVQGKCFGGNNKRPDHGLEVIEFFYSKGCEVQNAGSLAPGNEHIYTGKTTDKKCLNVKVKNNSKDNKGLTSNQMIDAWAREWIGCEHGGTTTYDDKLEYACMEVYQAQPVLGLPIDVEMCENALTEGPCDTFEIDWSVCEKCTRKKRAAQAESQVPVPPEGTKPIIKPIIKPNRGTTTGDHGGALHAFKTFVSNDQQGSGKSTLAKTVITRLPQFNRLSIDEIIYTDHGLYGVDYAADERLYVQYQEEAGQTFLGHLQDLLKNGKDIVLDRSFYAKEDRDDFRRIVADGGGRWVLVYLKAGNKEKLWERICGRSTMRRDANSALDITREIFDMYWRGFEEPCGEGEVVVQVL